MLSLEAPLQAYNLLVQLVVLSEWQLLDLLMVFSAFFSERNHLKTIAPIQRNISKTKNEEVIREKGIFHNNINWQYYRDHYRLRNLCPDFFLLNCIDKVPLQKF